MSPDEKAALEEIYIAVEGALAAGEIVAKADIVESQSFNMMMVFLFDAADAVSRIREPQSEEPAPKVAEIKARVLKLVSSRE